MTTKTKTEETDRLKANTEEHSPMEIEMEVFKRNEPEQPEVDFEKLKEEMAGQDFENPDVQRDFVKRLEEKLSGYAEQMHKNRLIYLIYGLFDGLNISYSLLKLIFDLIYSKLGGNPDAMHDWTLTPAGIAAAAAESLTLITFAMLANYYKDDDPQQLKRMIATYWPYLRDVFKSTKNSYKGFRSTLSAVKVISGHNYSSLIFPVGLALGAISICCRLTMRTLVNKRKDLMDGNAKLLQDIQNKQSITEEEAQAYRKLISQVYTEYKGINSDEQETIYRVGRQSTFDRVTGLTASAIGGVVDSLYLYMGALGLCALSGPFMGVMMGFCTLLALACVITRVYEEYNFQQRLIVRQDRIEMAITSKEYARDMQILITELNDLSLAAAMEPHNDAIPKKAEWKREEIKTKIADYKEKRKALQSKSLLSDTSAILDGMKNGLAAYSAIASAMFAVYTILALCSVSFPPALLASFVILGLVAVVGFTLYSYYQHRDHREALEEEAEKPERLIDFIEIPKSANAEANRITLQEIPELFDEYSLLDPGPRTLVAINSEVGRSLCTGTSKGFTLIKFTMNPLIQGDHDSKIILGFSIVSSFLYTVVMALRAYVRGYGRPDDYYTEHLVFKNRKAMERAAKIAPPVESQLDEFMEKLPEDPISTPNTMPHLSNDLMIDTTKPIPVGDTHLEESHPPQLEEISASPPIASPTIRRTASVATNLFKFFKDNEVNLDRSPSLSAISEQLSTREATSIPSC